MVNCLVGGTEDRIPAEAESAKRGAKFGLILIRTSGRSRPSMVEDLSPFSRPPWMIDNGNNFSTLYSVNLFYQHLIFRSYHFH